MPVAFYALSYKDTGSVLAFCSLEQQTLVDAASVTALRDRLVGPGLSISISTRSGQPLNIAADDLVVDEVDVPDPRAIASDPYSRQILIPSDASTKPGDGKRKQLTQPGSNVSLKLDLQGNLTAKPANPPPPPVNMYAILEGHSALPVVLQVPNNTATFPFGGALTGGSAYAVLFVGQGLHTFVGLMKAE